MIPTSRRATQHQADHRGEGSFKGGELPDARRRVYRPGRRQACDDILGDGAADTEIILRIRRVRMN